MLLSEVLENLNKRGITVVGDWEMHGRHGLTIGDPKKYFPFPTGPQYPVDTTDSENPDLTPEEIEAIKRPLWTILSSRLSSNTLFKTLPKIRVAGNRSAT